MAPNCPVPPLWVGSRSTATRVTRGAISLSNSNHFPLMPYSNRRKPVVLPPGRAKLSNKTSADRIDEIDEHDGDGVAYLLYSRQCYGATRQHHVRRERDQFRCVFARVVGTAGTPAIVDSQVTADGPA